MAIDAPNTMIDMVPSYRDYAREERRYGEFLQGSGAIDIWGGVLSGATGSLNTQIILLKAAPPVAPGAVATIEDEILEIFGLSMEELAECCGVSRKTLYNWRDNESAINRKKPAMIRLFKIYQAARNWKRDGNECPVKSIREPILGDVSLFDLLKAEKIDIGTIAFAGRNVKFGRLDSKPLKKPFA